MKTSIYVRIETDKQETENQLSQPRQFADKQGWTITQEHTEAALDADRIRALSIRFLDTSSRRLRMSTS
jgi:DNA invertase Pin-like site-specific DNA recombinase